MSTADAALIEPLSCAVRGFDVLKPHLADHFLIYGAGTTGLMMMELAKRAGDLFVGGALRPDVMISDRFPLADYPRAIEQFKNGVGRKIQVNP